MRVAKQK